MTKKERIGRYSAKELAAKRQRGESRSDRAHAAAMTNEEIEADIATDPDEAGFTGSCSKTPPDCLSCVPRTDPVFHGVGLDRVNSKCEARNPKDGCGASFEFRVSFFGFDFTEVISLS